MEEWKRIDGWDYYEVSNHGRVRSTKRIVRWAHHGKEGIASKQEKLLKQIPRVYSKNLTYMQVGFHRPGCSKIYHVHRLVAKCFLPNPDNKPQVNHIDGDGRNNHVSNLEWVTERENSIHAWRVLKRKVWHKGNMGKRTPTARAVIQKTSDGEFVRRWDSGSDAVRAYGFDSGGITRTCQGKQTSHKGFKWEYENKQ